MKKVLILGSTGSVGKQAVQVIQESEELELISVVANQNISLLEEQVITHKIKKVGILNEQSAMEFRMRNQNCQVYTGEQGILDLIQGCTADIVVSSIVGIAGLKPTLTAIDAGMDIAFANKETLVTAGKFVMEKVLKKNICFLPVDSEHAAIHQCIGQQNAAVQRLILTASGGPFRSRALSSFEQITIEDALAHPTWKMGAKISIDSATMMNKALEVIEAHHLFGVSYDKIEAIIHPQSIIHSMVEFIDGNILAQLGHTDMRIPIQYALHYPNRKKLRLEPFDFFSKKLDFEPLDRKRYPLYELAIEEAQKGDFSCVVMNAANEVAVEWFLRGKIRFIDIVKEVERALHAFTGQISSIEDVIQLDRETRNFMKKI